MADVPATAAEVWHNLLLAYCTGMQLHNAALEIASAIGSDASGWLTEQQQRKRVWPAEIRRRRNVLTERMKALDALGDQAVGLDEQVKKLDLVLREMVDAV